MINLTAAKDNPVQAMDLTLPAHSLAALTDRAGHDLTSGAQPIPAVIDRQVASGLVELLGVEPDRGGRTGTPEPLSRGHGGGGAPTLVSHHLHVLLGEPGQSEGAMNWRGDSERATIRVSPIQP